MFNKTREGIDEQYKDQILPPDDPVLMKDLERPGQALWAALFEQEPEPPPFVAIFIRSVAAGTAVSVQPPLGMRSGNTQALETEDIMGRVLGPIVRRVSFLYGNDNVAVMITQVGQVWAASADDATAHVYSGRVPRTKMFLDVPGFILSIWNAVSLYSRADDPKVKVWGGVIFLCALAPTVAFGAYWYYALIKLSHAIQDTLVFLEVPFTVALIFSLSFSAFEIIGVLTRRTGVGLAFLSVVGMADIFLHSHYAFSVGYQRYEGDLVPAGFYALWGAILAVTPELLILMMFGLLWLTAPVVLLWLPLNLGSYVRQLWYYAQAENRKLRQIEKQLKPGNWEQRVIIDENGQVGQFYVKTIEERHA